MVIGIRREDKNEWERRVPLTPTDVKELKEKYSISTQVQPSKIRIFSDSEYIEAGASVQEDLSSCPIIFAVKEIPVEFFEPKKTYVFFSHTIKGQAESMPTLRRVLELGCQLIDYEKVVDEKGRRLIFFGKYAGIVGMINTLWALGKRFQYEGIETPFSDIKKAYQYENLKEAEDEIIKIGKKISTMGLPNLVTPFICGFTGYGNVSQGAQKILDLLPVQEIEPNELDKVNKNNKVIYKVVFKKKHMVELKTKYQLPNTEFELQDYYDYPENYKGMFEKYIPHLTILMNCIYWESRYPRLLTKKYLAETIHESPSPRLRVIGDISCDVEGAIECTLYTTDSGNPVFTYNPLDGKTTHGVEEEGPVVLAVDNLPCELPRESSTYFSEMLKKFVPDIVNADFTRNFEQCNLSPEIKNAVIVYHGKLTPNYEYLEKFLQKK